MFLYLFYDALYNYKKILNPPLPCGSSYIMQIGFPPTMLPSINKSHITGRS